MKNNKINENISNEYRKEKTPINNSNFIVTSYFTGSKELEKILFNWIAKKVCEDT